MSVEARLKALNIKRLFNSSISKFVELPPTEALNQHPIITYENKLQRKLRQIVKPKVEDRTYAKLYPQGGQMARLYGLAKIHKEDMPLRPVVSMISTPQYDFAKYLDTLIKPYRPCKYSLSSTYDLLEKLKHVSLSQNSVCVSFDVSSLFTNVPVGETIDIICNIVCDFPGFPYNKNELRTLLYLANESIFSFNGRTYKQIDGVSMGNPLAPTFAEFYMGHLEHRIFDTQHNDFYPTHYFRYVDDTLCLFDKEEKVDEFLNFLNSLNSHMKFTVEKSYNGCLPFLDIKFCINDGVITTEVYRKTTFTGRMLNFSSITPRNWKTGLIKTLVYRAYHLSSSWTIFHQEIINLRHILTFNGYPFWWLNKIVKNFLDNVYAASLSQTSNDDCNYIVIKVPFYGSPSIKLKKHINRLLRIFNNKKVKICFTCRRLRTVFALKDRQPTGLKSAIVYRFECSGDPNIRYVGETGRQLVRRVQEHLTTNTAVTTHLKTCTNCPKNIASLTENNFKVLHNTSDSFDRAVKEALYIQRLKPCLNTQITSGKKTYSLQLF